MSEAVVITRLEGPGHIDSVAGIYRHLHEAQTRAAPELGHMPERTGEESWARRRRSYVDWLSAPGAFLLVARRGETRVGFALVTFAGAYHGWQSGERVAELKDIAVVPEARGQGIGSRLLDAVEDELGGAGVSEYRLNVIAANADAVRLYRRRGMAHVTSVFLGRVPPRGSSTPAT